MTNTFFLNEATTELPLQHKSLYVFCLGAGDQGLMFGYATDETEELMPLTCVLSHKLNERLAECRRDGLPYLLPDSKTQVTVEYRMDDGACVPLRVHTVVVSSQHSKDITLEQMRKDIKEKVIDVSVICSVCWLVTYQLLIIIIIHQLFVPFVG